MRLLFRVVSLISLFLILTKKTASPKGKPKLRRKTLTAEDFGGEG